jgi:hypothetical protein
MEQFEKAVLVQYESQLSRDERVAADSFTKSFTDCEVRSLAGHSSTFGGRSEPH